MEGEGGMEFTGDHVNASGDWSGILEVEGTFELLPKLIQGGSPDRREPRLFEV